MKQCMSCGEHIKHRHHLALYCWTCTPSHRGQSRAMNMVHAAISAGTLDAPTKFKCACGARATEYEHRDYSRPLDVVPVCRTCNRNAGPAKTALREPRLFPMFSRVGDA